MVTIHLITYNEELMIEFFVRHYRKLFPNCIIKVYDNYSTDDTVKIAENLGCQINYYDSNNKLSDSKYLEIKNNCWKDSETDWVVVCDCDELISITEEELINESENGVTLFKFDGYNIVNTEDQLNLGELSFGFRDTIYDKTLLFNKSKINEINYQPGCHVSHPIGDVKYNTNIYKMLHYKYLGVEYTVSRYKMFADRLSDENKRMRWGYHYEENEVKLRKYYSEMNSRGLIKLI
jgi:hypothetical protein